MNITKVDRDLVKKAEEFLRKNYSKNKHHVACVLNCGVKNYYSLHLDTKGIDVCAEPTALSNALLDKQVEFRAIVSVMFREPNNVEVVSPCGNCRQMLFEYTPDLYVIVPSDTGIIKIKATELLPYPYKKLS